MCNPHPYHHHAFCSVKSQTAFYLLESKISLYEAGKSFTSLCDVAHCDECTAIVICTVQLPVCFWKGLFQETSCLMAAGVYRILLLLSVCTLHAVFHCCYWHRPGKANKIYVCESQHAIQKVLNLQGVVWFQHYCHPFKCSHSPAIKPSGLLSVSSPV